MNAPLSASISNIKVFRNILADGLVEETLARQKETQENKVYTLHSLDRLEINCNELSNRMQELRFVLEQQSRNFDKLQNACNKIAASMEQLRRSSKDLSESLTATGKTIRKSFGREASRRSQ